MNQETPEGPTHEEIILARIGEINLKGLNRGSFERRLLDNLKRRLKPLGTYSVRHNQSRIWIEPAGTGQTSEPAFARNQVLQAAASVFGIVSASPVWRFSGQMPEIIGQAGLFVGRILSDGHEKTFKVEARRGNKHFPLTSPEISNQVGAALIERFPGLLRVDVHQPDFVLTVEVRDDIFLYSEIIKGQKGLPVGTGGRGLLLLSGGIDSPVAGYMMASRGMELEAVYFHAYPFTSDKAREKVVELASQLIRYCGRLKLHIVHFTDIQLALRAHSVPELSTLLMRRMMMRIASRLAVANGCQALITGDSLGQVASQTVEAIRVADEAAGLPVFRPLIGMDKDDTIVIARRIGTFDTSILPYEDCCTVFVAKHPRIHPSLQEIAAAESGLDLEKLIDQGLAGIEEVQL